MSIYTSELQVRDHGREKKTTLSCHTLSLANGDVST